MVSENRLLAPPQALISRNPIKWLRFFGPGAIIASLTIGSGETLFSSRGGCIFGYRILWVLLFISLLKWVLAYSSMRHMILSGGHPFDRWSLVGGPRGWFPLFMFLTALVCYPPWFSFAAGLLGTACTWMFGFGTHYVWATVFVGAAVILLAIRSYNFFEKAQMLILALKVGCIIVAVFYLRPDWLAVANGLVLPQWLAYPDWLFKKLPEFRDRSVWVEILVYGSAIGGASFDYLGYVSFLREKKWGWSHLGIASEQELNQTARQTDHPARLWVRAALIDTVVSFSMVVVLSSCFAILGTIVLQPLHQVPEGINLLNYQASFLTALSSWLLPLYKIAIFFAFFGSLYGGPELAYRVIYEYLNTLPRWRGRLPAERIRSAVIAWLLGGGLLILWLSRFYPGVQLIDIVTPAAIYTGVLSCAFYCLANPWMDWRFLPAALRMPAPLVVLNLLAGIAFMAMGVKALWDYGRYSAFFALLALLLACVFLTSRLRFLHAGGITTRRPLATEVE